MPNSFDHCSTCTFDGLVPADYAGMEFEDREVRKYLSNLGKESSGTMYEPLEKLTAKQQLAARGCAASIFHGQCPKFEWRTSDNENDQILAIRDGRQAQ